MVTLTSVLIIVHLIGLALGTGAATVKNLLLLKCRTDYSFLPVYIKAARPITKVIISGMVLLTLSGIAFLINGYPFITALIIKIVLVLGLWAVGPVIDNVVEPKFLQLAGTANQTPSSEFAAVMRRYLTIEIGATAAFYVIIIYWILA